MAFAPVARYVEGNPLMVDHTPASVAVNAGDVLLINGHLSIVHLDIAATVLGAVACGGGVYDFLRNASDTFADRATVTFNSTVNKATSAAAASSANNYALGIAIGSSGNVTTNSYVRVAVLAPGTL